MTPIQKRSRREWCKEHKNWLERDWKNVIWTDEVTFEVGKDSRNIWVT